jgi:hypothetical protein
MNTVAEGSISAMEQGGALANVGDVHAAGYQGLVPFPDLFHQALYILGPVRAAK